MTGLAENGAAAKNRAASLTCISPAGLSNDNANFNAAPMFVPSSTSIAWNSPKLRDILEHRTLGAQVTDTQDGGDIAVFDAEVRSLVVAGRQRQAADLLLTRLSPELRPFLHRLLGDVSLADEAHSSTCERLWRGLSAFRWECSLRSWSYIIARREASRCRARHVRAGIQQTTLSKAEGVEAHVGSTAGALTTKRRDQLEGLRASLSDEDRDLLVLRVERGLAWKEIAAAFLEEDDSDPDTIGREAARLRQRFRAIRVRVASAISSRSIKEDSPEKP